MKRNVTLGPHPHYHDTLKLLQKYRDVNWSIEVSSQYLESEFRAEYGNVSPDHLDDLGLGGSKHSAERLEGVAASQQKSKRLLELVNKAVDLMRQKHKKGELYYWVLYYTYLSPQEPANVNEILIQLEKHFPPMSVRTYYGKREEAVNILSSVLWGYTSKECQDIVQSLFSEQ